MEGFFQTTLGDPVWWFTVVVVGFMVNVAAAELWPIFKERSVNAYRSWKDTIKNREEQQEQRKSLSEQRRQRLQEKQEKQQKQLQEKQAAQERIRNDPSVPIFFSISKRKLIIMHIVTFGYYELYWAYKHWSLFKIKTGEDVNPAYRAFLFYAFNFYPLVKNISFVARELQTRKLAPWLLTLLFVIQTLSVATFTSPIATTAATLAAFFYLIPIQSVVNAINAKIAPLAPINDKFSRIEVFIVITLGTLWALRTLAEITELIEFLGQNS